MNRLTHRDTVIPKNFIEYNFIVKLFVANGIEVYHSVRAKTSEEFGSYPHLHWSTDSGEEFLSANRADPGDKRYQWITIEEFLDKAGISHDKEYLRLIQMRSDHNEGRKITHTFI